MVCVFVPAESQAHWLDADDEQAGWDTDGVNSDSNSRGAAAEAAGWEAETATGMGLIMLIM